MIVAGGRLNLIAAAQHVLPNELHRHVRIARLGEITEARAADESSFALRIEPAERLAVWNDRRQRCARFTALSLLSAASTTTASAATLSASALIAAAASIVTIIAMTFALLLALALTASTTTAL